MNRKQRRSKKHHTASSPSRYPSIGKPDAAPDVRPGLLLRMFARVLLSDWVLARVRHQDVRRLLANIASQAGQADKVRQILNEASGGK